MSFRIAWTLCKKELLEVRRDLRTLALLVVLPALLYPLLMIGMSKVGAAGVQKLAERELVVAVERPLPEDVEAALASLENVRVIPAGGPEVTAPTDEKPAATLRVAHEGQELVHAKVEIVIDGGTELGLTARGRLVEPLRDARRATRDARLKALGVPDHEVAVARVDVIDVAPPAKKGGFLLGRVMVPILLVVLLLGAYYPAIDMTVGERERQTLRTLLCAPVPPMAIALGKLMAVSLLALGAATANLLGLLLTARIGVMGIEGFEVPAATVAVALVLCVPMAIYTGAILMAAASLTKSVREAQTLLTPLLLVLLLPAMIAALPGVEVSVALALVPLLGPALVVRDAFTGVLDPVHLAAAVLGGLATAVALLGLAARAFSVEALLTGRLHAPGRAPGPLPTFDGVLLALSLAAGFIYVGVPLQARDITTGLVVTQIAVFAGIPLVWAFARSTTPIAALGLALEPRRGALEMTLGALLLLPTLGALVSVPAERLVDEKEAAAFEAMFEQLLTLPAPLFVLLIAVLPGICEELAFRGALLRAFSRRSAAVGVVVTAALFALFHGSAARFVPTFVLGVVVGAVAAGSRSTWPAMALHACHNGFALVLASLAASSPVATSAAAVLPWPVHLLCLPGIALIAWGARRAQGVAAPSAVLDRAAGPS